MLRLFDSLDLLQTNLANHIYLSSQEAISSRGRFTVALSGGSLPKMLNKLARCQEAINQDINWEKWYFIFADERIVPLHDEDSTFKLCQDVFFSKLQHKTEETFVPQVIPIDPSFSDASMVASDYENKLKDLLGEEMVVDLALLGMGPDGHTASLFPNHPLVLDAFNDKVAQIKYITDSPKPPPKRITFNIPMLNKARECIFVATGSSKAPLFQNAFTIRSNDEQELDQDRNGNESSVQDDTKQEITLHSFSSTQYDLIRNYPCFMIRPLSGKLTWYTDLEGGSLLPPEILQLARENALASIDNKKDSKL